MSKQIGEGIYPYRQPRFLNEGVDRILVELSPVTDAMKELCGEGWEPEPVPVIKPLFPRLQPCHNNVYRTKFTMAEYEADMKRRRNEFMRDYPTTDEAFMKPEGTENDV